MILLPVLTLPLVPLFHIMHGTARFERHVLSATPHVDLQSAHTLADVLVGGVNRHTSVAEAADGFGSDAPGAPSDSAIS